MFFSVSFSQFNLDARLMRAIEKSGYVEPTPIQAAAIPVALTGADLIGTAQTGTGKTAAFVLPMLQHLLNDEADAAEAKPASKPTAKSRRKPHRALIVTPTRELAEQINDTIRVLAQFTDIRSATIYGGVGTQDQERALKAGVEILVACPGRLLDHVDSGLCKLDGIEILVLDEADRMLDMGFMPAVRRILQSVPKQRQTMLFSATFPGEVEELATAAVHQPERIAIGRVQPATTITHALYPVRQHLKKKLLVTLLRKEDAFSMLVFTRTKHRAEAVARQLTREGFKTTSLHSDRSQNQRQAALNGFKSGKYQVMVATDIAARGLDVESVSHVINYDVPDTVDAYIHRIGRTGRAQQEGDAFTLVTPEDGEMVRDIERALGQKITRLTVEGFDYDAAAPEPTPEQLARQATQTRGNGRGNARAVRGNESRGSAYGGARSGAHSSAQGGSRSAGTPNRNTWNSRTARPEPVGVKSNQPDNSLSEYNNGEFDIEPQPSPERLEKLHSKTSGDLRREQARREQPGRGQGRAYQGSGQGSGNSQSQGGGRGRSQQQGRRNGAPAQGNSSGGNRGNSANRNTSQANGNSSSSYASNANSSTGRRPLKKRPFSRNRAG